MLKRRYHLRSRRDFQRLYKTGRSARGPGLVIRLAPNHLPYTRAAVVASTKVAKSAPVRNRLRRQVWGILRTIWPELKPGFDLIITIQPQLGHRAAPQIATTLKTCLKHLNLLK